MKSIYFFEPTTVALTVALRHDGVNYFVIVIKTISFCLLQKYSNFTFKGPVVIYL